MSCIEWAESLLKTKPPYYLNIVVNKKSTNYLQRLILFIQNMIESAEANDKDSLIYNVLLCKFHSFEFSYIREAQIYFRQLK